MVFQAHVTERIQKRKWSKNNNNNNNNNNKSTNIKDNYRFRLDLNWLLGLIHTDDSTLGSALKSSHMQKFRSI